MSLIKRISELVLLVFIKKYEEHGTTQRLPGSGLRSLVTPRVVAAIEVRMEDDDETTASQLHTHLASRGFSLLLSTIR